MKKLIWPDLGAFIAWLLPVIYLLFTYPAMPKIVPMHYGIEGTVDRYGSKSEFLAFQSLMLFAGPGVYLLLKFLPSIDPKKQVKYGEGTFQRIGLGIIIFMSALNIAIIFSTVNHEFRLDKLILPLIGLFFAFMGNMMHSIKPNYFAGIRTPWTLENEDTWRATHRLAGKLWFVGGIALSISVLLTPIAAGTIIFMCGIGIMVFIPIIYSYVYFKKHQLNA